MSRKWMTVTLFLTDVLICASVFVVSLFIGCGEGNERMVFEVAQTCLPAVVTIRVAFFFRFGLYRRLWRYASVGDLLAIAGAVTVGSVVIAIVAPFAGVQLPVGIHVVSWLMNIVFIGFSRMVIRFYSYRWSPSRSRETRSLIIGAGDAGATIAREIRQRYSDTKKLIGFIDDDAYKQRKTLFGAPVLGTRHDVERIVREYRVNEIIIAMPSVDGTVLREIMRGCRLPGCGLKIVPGIYELLDGKVTVKQLRDVDLEDLLRREPVTLDMEGTAGYLAGKRVLVTGAGGSIGSELCRQIAKLSPHTLLLIGKGENSIYEIDRELKEKSERIHVVPIIADIRSERRMKAVFSKYKPQVVFHAAAHKHVPLMESQPGEAVSNNIFGTRVVAEAAAASGSELFVMISTDKAVNPTSVMGATKRVAELVVQSMNLQAETRFTAVRFGNVLGSRGSVIPLFRRQIAKGGPVTITHPDMLRYFMTIPEACQLVIQAGAAARGGEVFVLDMGEPVRILDMAQDLIELSGLRPGRDIEIKFTGLRPGEKLCEELLTAEEGTMATKHKGIFRANLRPVDDAQLRQWLLRLEAAEEPDEITRIISELDPAFRRREVSVNTAAAEQLKNGARQTPLEGGAVLCPAEG